MVVCTWECPISLIRAGNWTEVLNTALSVNSRDMQQLSGTTSSLSPVRLFDYSFPLDSGEYYALRIYFGSSVTLKKYDQSTGSVVDQSTRSDFNTHLNPLILYSTESQYIRDNYPSGNYVDNRVDYSSDECIKIARARMSEIHINLRPNADKILGTSIDWAEFRDSLGDKNLTGNIPIKILIYNYNAVESRGFGF